MEEIDENELNAACKLCKYRKLNYCLDCYCSECIYSLNSNSYLQLVKKINYGKNR